MLNYGLVNHEFTSNGGDMLASPNRVLFVKSF